MTTSQPETLVTRELEDLKDQWSESRYSWPVALSDIRKWAIATYWPEKPSRLFWDEEYARTTRYGGIIAPLDFNPFAWPVERDPSRSGPGPRGAATRGMNGGTTDWYHVPIRPGDVVSTSSALVSWYERQTRLGLTIFTTTESRWFNQNNEMVKVRHSILIGY